MNERYKILFESVKIGPKTAKNRFYQVPHAMGSGNDMPNTRAAQRGIKAEGGWAVVNTGYCSIHPSSDDRPLPFARLWSEKDMSMMHLLALNFFTVVPTQQIDTLECHPFHLPEYNKKSVN